MRIAISDHNFYLSRHICKTSINRHNLLLNIWWFKKKFDKKQPNKWKK